MRDSFALQVLGWAPRNKNTMLILFQQVMEALRMVSQARVCALWRVGDPPEGQLCLQTKCLHVPLGLAHTACLTQDSWLLLWQ